VKQSPSAEQVRQRMQAIRQNLSPEVDEIVSNARDLMDWHYYVKAFPWWSLAGAAVLGYLAVPRKLEIIRPDAGTIEKLAKHNQLVVEHKSQAKEKPGVVESILHLTANMVVRAGVAYLGQKMGRLFGEQAAQNPAMTTESEQP